MSSTLLNTPRRTAILKSHMDSLIVPANRVSDESTGRLQAVTRDQTSSLGFLNKHFHWLQYIFRHRHDNKRKKQQGDATFERDPQTSQDSQPLPTKENKKKFSTMNTHPPTQAP
jgi:hypothetical protein